MELEIISPKHGKFICFYDKKDHKLISQHRWGIRHKNGKTYVRTNHYYDSKSHFIDMHRLILEYPKLNIDHIDGDGLNNRRSNLRLSTQRQNTKNMKLSKLNKFGLKGVSFDKNKNKFSCYITCDYKHIFGGYFNTPIEAGIKYNELAIKHHGKFAKLNVI